jgi:hypothetical protein
VFIDTPVGLFEVAEACSGVKFLIAMVALGTLVAHLWFASPRRRAVSCLRPWSFRCSPTACGPWGTIYVAQSRGVAFAAGFDHIVYGWIFFAIVMAAVLGIAWRFFDRSQDGSLVDAAAFDRLPWSAGSRDWIGWLVGDGGNLHARSRGGMDGPHARPAVTVSGGCAGLRGYSIAARSSRSTPRGLSGCATRSSTAGPTRPECGPRPASASVSGGLAIIDLVGSPQPMHAADGRAVLVFNGEIYNFRELRRELKDLGAEFRTDGDGEVILAAWQRWGSSACGGCTACSPSRSTTPRRARCSSRATGSG